MYLREKDNDEIPTPTPLENVLTEPGEVVQLIVAVMPDVRRTQSKGGRKNPYDSRVDGGRVKKTFRRQRLFVSAKRDPPRAAPVAMKDKQAPPLAGGGGHEGPERVRVADLPVYAVDILSYESPPL